MFTDAAVRFTHADTEEACADALLSSDRCADEIEQRIVRAHMQLMFQADDADDPRSLVVMRLGAIEIRLTELRLSEVGSTLPPLWIEVFDWMEETSIDSIGCYGFDDDEMPAAVAMIVNAARESQSRNGAPRH